MSNITSKKPKLRFSGFTDDWEQRKLSELITEYKETVDSNCTLPVLTSSKTEGVVLQEDHFGNKQKHDISGYNILPRNYCTYRNRSDGVDFTFNINKCCDIGIISKFYPVFCGNNSDIFFISLVLNNDEEVIREIGYTCKGTGQKVLSFIDLQKMNIRVPSYDEQKKISAYFTQLDNLITLHQRKCDNLKTLKKAMLTKMFPKNGEKVPEIRFPGFTDDWEQRKYEDFCSIVTKQTGFDYTATIKNALVQEPSDDTLPYLQTKNFTGTAIDYNTDYYIPKSVAKDFPKINLDEKCVLFSIVGASVGNIGLFPGDKHCFLSGAICISKFNDETDADYLYHFMCSEGGQSQIRTCTKGGAQATVTIEDIRNFAVKVPSKAERDKVGQFLNDLDNLITLHQSKCDELKELKKAMLQQMFV